MLRELDELASRRVVLFGGKGGVGKTTLSAAAALHYAETRPVTLFTTDPASSLGDLLTAQPNLTIEALDATALYTRFLGQNLESFLEIGDRGTYLDREELRRLFELALPGIDELMAWMRIGELAESAQMLVVDTAPTGHTLRMLSASNHFHQLARALDAMQEKHRAMVYQFTRREVRDALDAFIEDFESSAARRRSLLVSDGAFVPVTLAEPLVIEQTLRLIHDVEIPVPFVIVNRARGGESVPGQRTVLAMRSCIPLDSPERIRSWSVAAQPPLAVLPAKPTASRPKAAVKTAALLFLAGKGGVGKTSCSASIALQLAMKNPAQNYVVISVDPAHSLRDLHLQAPANLRVEIVDTQAKWRAFRETLGREIEDAVDSLTPRGLSLEHDAEAMRRLVEIAPPGADELFAITRLADLFADESLAAVVVDTAPTGHFLRLLDLPRVAGEWVREFMRLLLRYKDLIPAGSLGEELVNASRALKSLDAALRSDRAAVIVVTRPERIVIAETQRLIENVRSRGIRIGGVIANYVTPSNDDPCDQSMRAYELEALETLDDAVIIERRERPPMTAAELAALVPL